MQHEIWYSVENCGDGSAYPKFMESEALCEIDQQYMAEGWGESCVGCLVVLSDSPMLVEGIISVDDAIKEVEDELQEDYMLAYKKRGLYLGWFERLEGKLAALKALKATKQGAPPNADV